MRSEAVFMTAETSTAPAAMAWACLAPELMDFHSTLTPSFSKAFSSMPFSFMTMF